MRTKSHNLAAGAMSLLVTVIVLALVALVGGKFFGAIPSDGTFGSQISTLTDNVGTALTIFGVAVLIVPAATAIGYLYRELGGFVGGMRR